MNIILTGFMGTGKTSVAKILARKLGKEFVDLDVNIEKQEGCSINKIFKDKGEEYFRDKETEETYRASNRDNLVIATGGGVVLREENMKAFERNGIVICLTAKPKVILERVKDDVSRPLLHCNDPLLKINQLLNKRKPFYERSSLMIDTSSLSMEEVVHIIVEGIPFESRATISNNPYSIFVGRPYIECVKHHFLPKTSKVLVITDENVYKNYAGSLQKALEKEGYSVKELVLVPGESTKNIDTVRHIYKICTEHDMDRGSLIIALGGGVVGDIAGFVASTYLRGISYVQLPTTLLAQVDASIGGKTGVDLPEGKNLVGTFYQPKLVWIDYNVLHTLSTEEYKNGLAEVIKYGIIADENICDFLMDNTKSVFNREDKTLQYIVSKCAAIKADVVARDEKEKDIRRILNFGHTLGHAIETYENYSGIKHGEAVAVGMVFSGFVGQKIDRCTKETENRIKDIVFKLGFGECVEKYRKEFRENAFIEAILAIMKRDKKMRTGQIHFVIPVRIGEVEVVPFEMDDMKQFLNDWGNI